MNIIKNKRLINLIILVSLICVNAICDSYSEGELYFRQNRFSQAVPLFVSALNEKNVNPNVYNLLGLAYYQLGKFQQSLEVFMLGASKENTNKSVLYYNAGNAEFALGNYDEAIQKYSASFALDENFASPVLNRANAKLKLNSLLDAIDDYALYLTLASENPQRETIEKLMTILRDEYENNTLHFSENANVGGNDDVIDYALFVPNADNSDNDSSFENDVVSENDDVIFYDKQAENPNQNAAQKNAVELADYDDVSYFDDDIIAYEILEVPIKSKKTPFEVVTPLENEFTEDIIEYENLDNENDKIEYDFSNDSHPTDDIIDFR